MMTFNEQGQPQEINCGSFVATVILYPDGDYGVSIPWKSPDQATLVGSLDELAELAERLLTTLEVIQSEN